jgi:hypothetical protein
MTKSSHPSITIHLILSLLAGLGLGLAYSWFLSPVTYVDANPSLLRDDFKDQYRIVIAASYAATQDLPRARARLSLLGDPDPVAALSAQAQRMLASGEPFDKVRPLAQLATDLNQGFTSAPFTPTSLPTFNTPEIAASPTIPFEEVETGEPPDEPTITPFPTVFFEQTPLTPLFNETPAPRPTATRTPPPGAPFMLIGQDVLCETALPRGLLQFMLMDSRNGQAAGIEIVVTWDRGEDRFFTGFKPELGSGYADFVMQSETVYNIRIVTGGSFVPNISAPVCTDTTGASYLGSLLLTFQQP